MLPVLQTTVHPSMLRWSRNFLTKGLFSWGKSTWMSLLWGKGIVINGSVLTVSNEYFQTPYYFINSLMKLFYGFLHIQKETFLITGWQFSYLFIDRFISLTVRAVLTGLSVRWGTPGAILRPTESRQRQHQTLTGSSQEEVQEEVLQLWPHSPATCEGTEGTYLRVA